MLIQSYVTYDRLPGYAHFYKKTLVTFVMDKPEKPETLQKYLNRYSTSYHMFVTGRYFEYEPTFDPVPFHNLFENSQDHWITQYDKNAELEGYEKEPAEQFAELSKRLFAMLPLNRRVKKYKVIVTMELHDLNMRMYDNPKCVLDYLIKQSLIVVPKMENDNTKPFWGQVNIAYRSLSDNRKYINYFDTDKETSNTPHDGA